MRPTPLLRPLALVGVLGLVTVACADGAASPSTTSATSATTSAAAPDDVRDHLVDREFVSTAVLVDGEPHALFDGVVVGLGFAGAGSAGVAVRASADCNGISGTGELTGDGALVVEGLSMTEMGCAAPGAHDRDGWLAEFLASRPDVTVDGDTLVLDNGPQRVELVDREVAEPDLPLVGTSWVLTAVTTGDGPDGAVSSVPEGVEATLKFGDDGLVLLHDGCNVGSAQYEAADGQVRIGAVVSTLRGCGGAEGDVAAAFGSVVGAGVVDFEIDADRLHLDAGGAGLTFSAVAQASS